MADRKSTASTSPRKDNEDAIAGLVAALSDLGVSCKTPENTEGRETAALLHTASTVIHQLARQVNYLKVQRDIVSPFREQWFWTWEVKKNTIKIESTVTARGPRRRHRTASWQALINPEDTSAIAAIEAFPTTTQDALEVPVTMRAADGQWRDLIWQGRVTNKASDGTALFVTGVLKTTEKMAQASAHGTGHLGAEKIKLDFLANFSHEIRTPLTAILGASCIASESNEINELKELLGTIRTSAEALSALLGDTLEFSQIVAGKIRCNLIPEDMTKLILEVCRLFAFEAHKKGVSLILRLSPDFPSSLSFDPVRVRQVLTNLLANAVKFTEEGEIEISAALGSENNIEYVDILVRDTGIGIAPEKQKTIFEMFAQGDSTTKRRYGGTGLGLTISRRLAEMMGGTLTVESAGDNGSVFKLSLPSKTTENKPIVVDRQQIRGQHVAIAVTNPTQGKALAEMVTAIGGCPVLSDSLSSLAAIAERMTAQRVSPSFWLIDEGICHTENSWEKFTSLTARLCIAPRRIIFLQDSVPQQRKGRAPTECLSISKPFSVRELVSAIERSINEPCKTNASLAIEFCESPAEPKFQVLLAEDNAMNRSVIAKFLKRRGHNVVEAVDGEDAVEIFQRKALAFDIILMDIQMPKMDGFEAAEAIRSCEERRSWVALECWRSTPILALTADALADIEQKCLDAGMDGVLLKPATPEQLIAAVQKTCREAKARHLETAAEISRARNSFLATTPNDASRRDFVNDLVRRLNKSVLNLSVPLAWVGNDFAELKKVVALSQAELREFCQRGNVLAMVPDPHEFGRLVHRTKSSLKILGAESTVSIAEAMMASCLDGDEKEIQVLWPRLRTNCAQLSQLLEQVEGIIDISLAEPGSQTTDG